MQAKIAKKGLGRGFDALIPQNFDESVLLDSNERIQKLSVGSISPNKSQPRQHFDESALDELAASIKQYGILQPLVVTPLSGGGYQIVAGERRWRAAQKAGLKQVPAIVRTSKELEQLEIALIENVQRVDLSPLEQAQSIVRLKEQFNMDFGTIASRLGKAASSVNNTARLLQLPETARQALAEQKITEGHARSILALKGDDTKQQELLEAIVKRGWSVRQAEQFVTAVKQGAPTAQEARERVKPVNPQTRQLSALLKTPVKIRHTAHGGRLELSFTSAEDLSALLQKLIDNLR